MFEPLDPPSPPEILRFRKRLGLTQTDMATFLGVSLSCYRNFEKGRQQAHPIVSRVICWIEGGYVPPEFIALGLSLSPERPEGD